MAESKPTRILATIARLGRSTIAPIDGAGTGGTLIVGENTCSTCGGRRLLTALMIQPSVKALTIYLASNVARPSIFGERGTSILPTAL